MPADGLEGLYPRSRAALRCRPPVAVSAGRPPWDGRPLGSAMTRQFGAYELDSLIGAGGMGEVWRANDTRRDRLVAVKLLPESLGRDQEFLSRFRRESHVAARLREPHVIPIHDYGEIDGQ